MTPPHERGELFSQLDTQLEDGTPISIRPIRPSDIDDLVAFHDRLSADTVYRRFFGPHPHLSLEEARRFTTVDYQNRFALVARCAGQLVAVGRFDRVPGTDVAELAFVVADALQGHGIAPLLLRLLGSAAHHRGIRRFEADTLSSNNAMLDVFRSSGFDLAQSWDGGVVHIEFPLEGRVASEL